MNTYCSTFIIGFNEVIIGALKDQFIDVEIELVLNGVILYSTSAPLDDLKQLRYFNNTFILIHKVSVTTDDGNAKIIKKFMREADIRNSVKHLTDSKKTTFRIIISRESDLISVNKEIINKIEDKITQETSLTLKRDKADYEFWFLIRKEGYAFFGIRITKLKKRYIKGELHIELAYLLCLLSKPDNNDIFLDPFCGSGAIPIERALSFPYQEILACDTIVNSYSHITHAAKKYTNFRVHPSNTLKLHWINNEYIDKIVTDPPWGLYKPAKKDYKQLYAKMLKEFIRVIKKGGIIIIVMARNGIFDKIIKEKNSQVALLKYYDILVSGKKARVYSMTKM